MNPSPYVSRFASEYQIGTMLPSCRSHYNLLHSSTSSMMTFFYQSSFDSHATTHSLIGGVYGCDQLIPLLEKGYINDVSSLKSICSKWIFQMKEYYRYNFITPKSECSVSSSRDTESLEISQSECGFTCNFQDSSENEVVTTSKGSISKEIFLSIIKTKLKGLIPSNITQEGLEEWKEFICSGNGYKIFAGDHLESASPADPSFYVIHPTLERLFHAKQMLTGYNSNGFTSTTWASSAIKEFVCEKTRCYDTTSSLISVHEDCCYGHYQHDQLLDAISGDRSSRYGLSNQEMLANTNPLNEDYSVNYIYDSFTWNHCSEDFNGLMIPQ